MSAPASLQTLIGRYVVERRRLGSRQQTRSISAAWHAICAP